jgi:hypothetical protein
MRLSKGLWMAVVSACALVAAGCSPASAVGGGQYAEDRSAIEDLQARYLFALDFRDAGAYAATFTADGLLDYGAGEIRGREAIADMVRGLADRARLQAAEDTSGLRPAAGRHHITNIVVRIDGDRATGRAYWFHTGNSNSERRAELTSFGHYEDEMVRVDGEWLFSSRKIYNEQVADWAATGANPAW